MKTKLLQKHDPKESTCAHCCACCLQIIKTTIHWACFLSQMAERNDQQEDPVQQTLLHQQHGKDLRQDLIHTIRQRKSDMQRARQDVLRLRRVLLSLSTGNENQPFICVCVWEREIESVLIFIGLGGITCLWYFILQNTSRGRARRIRRRRNPS